MKIWLVIAETLGTDEEYYTEVYPVKSSQEAGEFATSLVADMAQTMDAECLNPDTNWELEGDNWFYRVRIQEEEI